MFKSCLNSCLYEDRTTSCIGLQNYAPPLQNRLPYIITSPTKSHPLQNHQPYKITSLTKSPTLQKHHLYKNTNSTKSTPLHNHQPCNMAFLQNHLPYKIASHTKTRTLQNRLPFIIINPATWPPYKIASPTSKVLRQRTWKRYKSSFKCYSLGISALYLFVNVVYSL